MALARRRPSISFVRLPSLRGDYTYNSSFSGGDVLPDAGQIMINGSSVISHPRITRSYLGVCPQFSTIDSQLTVREHLLVYGRLKGIRPGPELNRSVEAVLRDTSLTVYADRLANKLSGGNQKKLSLAIALIGNPAVLLIDEFSTGIDPKMKRDLWQTLRRAASGKAVIITTRQCLCTHVSRSWFTFCI
jgi:ATP-binding cassette subfamily A (ABC1) protein 3